MGPNNNWLSGSYVNGMSNPGTSNPYQVNNPWQNNAIQTPAQTNSGANLSQFAWINNPGVVDMWPMAAGSEMTFIDPEHRKLYVRRVDEWNHPVKTRVFDLIEVTNEPVKPQEHQINMDELKTYLSGEIDRAVNNKMSNMFSGFNASTTPAVVKTEG